MIERTAICIFAYNRYEHLNDTLDRLFEQDLQHCEVLIFQDGPVNEQDLNKTRKVHDLIESYPPSKFSHKEFHAQNKGLAASVFYGLDQTFKKYEQAIILEDDIRIRKGCISFFEKALSYYSSDERVAGISGFSYFSGDMKKNYFLPIGSSWGWATWRRAWMGLQNNPQFYLNQLHRCNRKAAFNFGTYPFLQILEDASAGKNDSWAIQFYAHFFLKSQLFLFPAISLCENTGFDNSGQNTGPELQLFNSSIETASVSERFPEPEIDERIMRKMKSHMKKMAGNDWRSKLARRISNIIHER